MTMYMMSFVGLGVQKKNSKSGMRGVWIRRIPLEFLMIDPIHSASHPPLPSHFYVTSRCVIQSQVYCLAGRF
jgi:hypothetical protein